MPNSFFLYNCGFYHSKIEKSQISLVTVFFEGTRENILHIIRASDININEDCSKYGSGRPGIFTSVQKLSDWIKLTLNDIKYKNLDRVENDSNINRPMFFVILSMIGSMFLGNK